MAAEIKFNIGGEDHLAPILRGLSKEELTLEQSMMRLAKQDFGERQAKAAALAYGKLSDAEKQSYLAMGKTQEAMDKAAIAAKKLADEQEKNAAKTSGFAGKWTELSSKINVASMAVRGFVEAGKKIKEVVDEYSNYVEAVDKMSMSTGMSAEQTSRLIQLADDFRVEQSSLTTAMKMALQNGFEPTIENLANLSDQYLSMTSVTERADAMQKIFGKQWENMVPMLERGGKAILEAGKGIGDGLVVTQQAIEENRKYQKSVDDLTDSWTAFKFTVLKDVVPALSTAMDDLAERERLVQAGFKGSELEKMVRVMRDARKADEDYSSSQRESAAATNAAARVAVKYTSSSHEMAMATKFSSDAILRNTNAMEAQIEIEKMEADAKKAIASATQAAATAQDNFNASYGAKAASSLSKYAGEGAKYREGLAIQDKVLGTNSAAAYDAQKAMDTLSQQFASGKITADQYKQGLEDQKPAWAALDDALLKANKGILDTTLSWQNLIQNFADANGMRIKIFTDIVSSGGGGGPNSGSNAGGKAGADDDIADSLRGRASGGNVYAGQPYMIGERGPEPFVPSRNGYVLSREDAKDALRGGSGSATRGGAGSVINFNGPVTIVANTNSELMREAERKAAQQRRSGAAKRTGSK